MASASPQQPPPADDDAASSSVKTFAPRNYQIEVFEVALRRNTIAVLDTGSGKTFIAIMLMKRVGEELRSSSDKRLTIFLAPTVHLVNQQFKVIKDHTDFTVEEYYGAKGVDEWSATSWQREISSIEVMVMTPQILLDALRKAFISMDIIGLLIFDECHRASGNHPYTKIMKEFYHQSSQKPHVFGMTASPVIGKGVASVTDCEDQISALESILDSMIFTVENRTELESCVPSAQEVSLFYDPVPVPHTDLKTKLQSLWDKFHTSVTYLEESPANQFSDISAKIKSKMKDLSSVYMKILYCLDDLGLICAHEAALICIDACHSPIEAEDCKFTKIITGKCTAVLKEALKLIEELLPQDPYQAVCNHQEAMRLGYVSPKLYELMSIFQSFECSSEVLCLIFVERIITAKVIDRFMGKLSCLSQFTFSFLTGGNSSKDALTPSMQKKVLELFRSGKVNLIFSTDVAEEGMDVRNCSYVIRFDLPKTVRSYVQSRGRARQKNSKYYLMLERGNVKHRDLLFSILRSERSVTSTALNRDVDSCGPQACEYKESNIYMVESTKAIVTPSFSISLINKYCDKLPRDKYYSPKPKFDFSCSGGMSYACTLTLPPSAPFQTLVGPICKSTLLAKQLVCLEACKKLHQLGALDDHLLPLVEKRLGVEALEKNGPCSGAGTTKRKELHGTTVVHALSGTWAHKSDAVTLQGFKISFSCDVEIYADFMLLMEADIDDDVANIEINCFLVNKTAKASVTRWGQVYLDPDQVEKAKSFQELLFNGLFGKLWTKSPGGQRSFLLDLKNNELWNSSKMYLLLPFSSKAENSCIDWSAVNACASVVKYMCNIYSEHVKPPHNENKAGNGPGSDKIQLADKSLEVGDLKEIVVLATHTGKIYSVLDVMLDMSAYSPFHADTGKSKVTSFGDYFRKKYHIELQHPKQPLLLLKQTHKAHNLLSSGIGLEGSGHADKKGQVARTQCNVYMPPELLIHIDISIHILKALYLLPSVMHRLESLMLASQLREEIGHHSSGRCTPILLILEAITTLRCCEDFSFERLELLGDSVLKYAVSSQLFLKWPKKHEGQLSTYRSWAVCNSTLHKLGANRKLQGYLRDGAFEARRWSAPGQLCIYPEPCSCGISTAEVPLDGVYCSEDSSVVCGKACDMGHRWICSKSIADCVEALIGAYYVGGGFGSALLLMRWFGIDVDFNENLVVQAKKNAELWMYEPRAEDIKALETKIGYVFETKGLLLEAMTHATQQELGAQYCYQRLEFLGDAVLDVLITRYLFNNHSNIDPGELTDLRSASVNNESFAQAAVKHSLQHHLQHYSGSLASQVTEYVNCLMESHGDEASQMRRCLKGPKVLADMVESIAGAVLIDTRMDLEKVWMIFEPLLSPIVTPDNLELAPMRELIELCCHLGYFISSKCTVAGDVVVIELGVQLKDVLLVREGEAKTKKGAKEKAAVLLLEDLKLRGISHTRCSSKRKQCEEDGNISGSSTPSDGENVDPPAKKQKTSDEFYLMDSQQNPSVPVLKAASKIIQNGEVPVPVAVTFTLAKGGPRIALYELCKKLRWPLPKFTASEHKTKSLQVISGGPDKKGGFISFISTIILHIPNFEAIELSGQRCADKKSSQDSAAFTMLKALEQQGRCILEERNF